MSFLFVDRILNLNPGVSATGVKHITANDQYWTMDNQNRPMFMPAMVGETLGQLAAWSVMKACDFKWRPVAGIVSDVAIDGAAYVGDTLVLQAQIKHWDEQVIEYACGAIVDGQSILTVEGALGPMQPMEAFIDPALTRIQFEKIDRPGELQTYDKNEALPSGQMILVNSIAQFDRIIEWQAGEKAVAQKMVSLSAPYFPDHFPRKPVLPLTILLGCKVELGLRLLSEESEAANEQCFRPTRMQRIKMSEFVQPGDVVTTTVTVKEQQAQQYVLQFRSEVAGKRVCLCEVVYARETSTV